MIAYGSPTWPVRVAHLFPDCTALPTGALRRLDPLEAARLPKCQRCVQRAYRAERIAAS